MRCIARAIPGLDVMSRSRFYQPPLLRIPIASRGSQREARLLASLNHPHIGTIYGIEESDGIRALVLELVEGVTLADRLRDHGGEGLPVPEALEIARQIADALDAAHDRGIVHRDLKPANIKITPAGTVKVLDFGLAKVVSGDAGMAGSGSRAPTITVDGTQRRNHSRHGRVHEPGAGTWSSRRQADRHLGVRLRSLRAADGPPCLRAQDRVRHDCRDSRTRP